MQREIRRHWRLDTLTDTHPGVRAVRARFPDGLPSIYNAVEIDRGSDAPPLVAEVQQHLGGSRVRAVALGSTDGLVRGMKVLDTGGPLMVPVGKETLGRAGFSSPSRMT